MRPLPGRSALIPLAAFAAMLAIAPASRAGYVVETYATTPLAPMNLSFAPTGELFVGSANNPGADSGYSWVMRVAVGGGMATRYGNATILDPDAILFDATGSISGVAGSVLVGGQAPWNGSFSRGQISAIRPDGSIQSFASPLFHNPVQMAFDSSGRMLFTDQGDPSSVFALLPGRSLSSVVQFSGARRPMGLAIGSGDLIYTTHADGLIRVHDSDGALVDNAFARVFDPTGLPPGGRQTFLGFAPGGMFGTDLYATTSAHFGDILRIGPGGETSTILSGLGPISGLAFGPDGALYLSDADNRRILRVTYDGRSGLVPEPSTILLSGAGLLAVVGLSRRGVRKPKA